MICKIVLPDSSILALSKVITNFKILPLNEDSKEWIEKIDFVNEGQPWLILPVIFIVDNEKLIIGCFDCGHGHDMLWLRDEWKITKQGIFEKDYVFLSDYYGYPEGALFKRINT